MTTGKSTEGLHGDGTAVDRIRRRQRFGFALAALVSVGFAVIVLLIAFMPEMLARPVGAGRALTHGLLWSIVFVLFTVAAMGVFVWHRNVLDGREGGAEP